MERSEQGVVSNKSATRFFVFRVAHSLVSSLHWACSSCMNWARGSGPNISRRSPSSTLTLTQLRSSECWPNRSLTSICFLQSNCVHQCHSKCFLLLTLAALHNLLFCTFFSACAPRTLWEPSNLPSAWSQGCFSKNNKVVYKPKCAWFYFSILISLVCNSLLYSKESFI